MIPDTTGAALWDSAQARYAQAAARLGEHVQDYCPGGVRIRLCSAGRTYATVIEAALRHRQMTVEGQPDVTLYLWESAASQVPGPECPVNPDSWQHEPSIDPRGVLSDAAVWAAFDRGSHTLSLFATQAQQGYFWVADPMALPHYEQGSPLRGLLSRALQTRGWFWSHAGAVGDAQGAVLLCGPGGSGKSTSVLACLEAGWGYLGDDYCLTRGGPTPQVASLYNTAKLKTPAEAARFSRLPPTRTERPDGKLIYWLYPECAAQLLDMAPLRAIVLPQITPGLGQSRLQPCSALQALRSLAPSSLLQVPGAGQATLQGLAHVVRAVSCHTLWLSPDIRQIPPLLQTLL